MAGQSNIPDRLILELPSSDLVNILQLFETKTPIININDALHNDAFSGYYTIVNQYVSEEDDDQVIISLYSLKDTTYMVQLFSPEALNNPELNPINNDETQS